MTRRNRTYACKVAGTSALVGVFAFGIPPTIAAAAGNPITFNTVLSTESGSKPQSITVADFDNDGDKDVAAFVALPNEMQVFFNDGTGQLALEASYATGANAADYAYTQRLGHADFDGDGHMDIALANYNSHTVSVWLNQGTGTFDSAAEVDTYEGSNYPTAIALKDFDADGNIDIGVSDYYEKFTVMLGLGDGTFDPEPIVTSTSGFSPDYPTQSIGVGDVNGDGKPDIVTSVKHMYGTVLINAGDGTFTPTQALDGALTGDSYGSVLSDVDGDGDLDMLRTQSDFKVYAAHNDGTGTFADFVAVGDASPDGSMGLAQADFNGDGIDDLTLGSSQFAVVSALSGDADGTFGTFTAPVSSPMIGTLAVAAADMNGDGKPDIVTGGNSSNYVGVLLNTSDFPAPAITAVSPSTGTAAGGTTVELTGSGFSDVTDVKVGGKSVPFTINGPGKITIQMPAGSPGSVDIVVTSPFGEGSAKFTYTSDGPAFTKPVTIEAGPVKGKGTKRHVSLNGTTRKAQKKVYVYRASTRNGPAKLIKVTNSRKHLWKIGRASLGGKSSAFFCARVGSHFSNTVRVPNRAKTITYAVRGDIVRCK